MDRQIITSIEEHRSEVRKVQERVKDCYNKQIGFRVEHGISHTTRTKHRLSAKPEVQMIDLSSMSNIIEFRSTPGTRESSIFVQAAVTMEQLVDSTLARNAICPIVTECRDMSVGGAFCGTAAESSSFRYGLFDQAVKSIQFVAGDGTCLTISRNDITHQLQDIANSYGTLGIVVALELRLIKVPPNAHVRLDYKCLRSVEAAIQELENARNNETTTDFIEGVLFQHEYLMIRGLIVQAPPTGQHKTFLSRRDPWFYMHLQEKLKILGEELSVDHVPLKDYLFRWDRGGFWMGEHAFKYFLTPFNKFTRWLLDPAMRTSVSLKAFQAAGLAHKYVAKDIGLPAGSVPTLLNWLRDHWGAYPILMWLVDVRQKPSYVNLDHQVLITLGVYGPPPNGADNTNRFCLELETKHLELGGIEAGYSPKWSPSHKWEQFWIPKAYDKVRREFHASKLPSIAEKIMDPGRRTRVSVMPRPIPGLYGVARVSFASFCKKIKPQSGWSEGYEQAAAFYAR